MIRIFLLVVCACFFSQSLQAQENVRIGIFDFPPFYSQTEKMPAQGILINLAKREMSEIERTADFQSYTTRTLIQNLINGDVDVGMLIKHPELIDTTLYSQKPISSIELVSFRGMNSHKVTSYLDLVNHDVLILAGYGYGGLVAQMQKLINPPNFIEASDIESGLDMLIGGRADYFLSYLKPSKEIARRKGYLSRDNWLISDDLSKFDVYWVVSKQIKGATELMRKLESVQ